jgi:hypothetical protein
MPRVKTKTKSSRGEKYNCVLCSDKIKSGDKYHEWKFRYGGTRRQHAEHGFPKPSQLTQSKLGEVYAAQEVAEEAIAAATEASDIADAIREVAQQARDTGEEYREAAEAMGGAGTENEERADTLEAFADELESEADDMEGQEWEADEEAEKEELGGHGDEPVNDEGDTHDEWLEALRSTAIEAIGALEL